MIGYCINSISMMMYDSSIATFASKRDGTVLPATVVASIAVLVAALGAILTLLMLYFRRKYKIHR